MIHYLSDLPANVAGFRAEGHITKDDFAKVVMPKVQELVDTYDELNYLLVLDTPLSNFSFGSWLQDAILGAKHFLKWNRAAIVSNKENIRAFTDMFGKIMPGEFRGFEHSQLQEAINWTSGAGAPAR
jgi:hypothetical protein